MRHWSQIATRNWRARPLRTLGATAAIALGTGVVVWVTCCFASVEQTVLDWAYQYVGRSHINVESPLGKYGTISASFLGAAADVDGVQHAVPRMMRRVSGLLTTPEKVAQAAVTHERWGQGTVELDVHGLDLARERYVRAWPLAPGGRMFHPGSANECVIERAFAEERGVGIGDRVLIFAARQTQPFEFEIVGLVDRRRIARFQKGLVLVDLARLQFIERQIGRLTSIDLVLADPTPVNIKAVATRVRLAIRSTAFGSLPNVRDTRGRLAQIENSRNQQQFVLSLLSCVGLLTALFIILSTLSMGMVERIAQLGLLRCVGLTRGQLATLVAAEVAPLGVGGVLAGIPIGLALVGLSVWAAPDYVGAFVISGTGVLLAVAAGLLTTAAAAVLPMIAALRVSPLEAAHPRARRSSKAPIVQAFVVGVAMLAGQVLVIEQLAVRSPWFIQPATAAVALLYLAYALAAPLVILLIGAPAVYVAAWLLRLRTQLLQDQVGHAVWRSTGIVCGLMVGLSLIVGLFVFSESFRSGWQFPKQFPAGYIWSFDQIRASENDVDRVMAGVPGIASFTTCNATNVYVGEKPVFMQSEMFSVTWFMGCEPAEFFKLVNVEFLEGDRETALEQLSRGGHIVVAEDFARSRSVGAGDTVKIIYANRPYQFQVAAVVASPALDIAAGYFQANTEMRVVASGSVLGTNNDMERLFGLTGRRLILMNFDLPPAPVPPDWPPPVAADARLGFQKRYYDESVPLERRWQRYRQDRVLQQARRDLGASQAYYGDVAELKDSIDKELSRVTRLLTTVPIVALVVAALGVANLMTANIVSRVKQLAILRAVGATRGLILRMVIGEAVVLGLLGSLMGVALGLHLAANTTQLTERMWGYEVALQLNWTFVSAAIILTVGLCVLAGVLPARNAARTDVVDALHRG